jgi:hypothetical protein
VMERLSSISSLMANASDCLFLVESVDKRELQPRSSSSRGRPVKLWPGLQEQPALDRVASPRHEVAGCPSSRQGAVEASALTKTQ